MKIKFLGTAAAEGIPGIFCKCDACKTARARGGRNIRTRSQAIIDGKLLIDFPADTYYHCLQHGIDLSDVLHCIITHTHSDHLYPNDVAMRIPGFAHIGDSVMNFYGSTGAMRRLSSYLHGVTESIDGFAKLNPLLPYQPAQAGEYTVTALEADHDRASHPFFYIIEKDGKALLYGNDTGYFLPEVWEYLEKAKPYFSFVSLDCTEAHTPEIFYNAHMNFGKNLQVRDRLVAMGCADEKTVFCSNHFSHNGKHVNYEEFSEIAAKDGFIASYDGLEIEF